MKLNVTFSEDEKFSPSFFENDMGFKTSFGDITVVPDTGNAVLFIPQSLDEEQQAIARDNISSPNADDIGSLEELVTEDKSSIVNAINELARTPSASSWDTLEGKPFESIGENLKVVNGALCVDTAPNVEEDNTKPITSAAVYAEIGNIDVLLSLI